MKPAGHSFWAACLLALELLVGCGARSQAESEPPTGPATGPPTPSGTASGPVQQWLAAFRVEADSNALEVDTQTIMEAAGSAIFAGPVGCFDGFPSEYVPAPDAYVLGVVAPTRAEVDAAVDRVGRTPLFVMRLTSMCLD